MPASEGLMTQEVHLKKGDALMFTDAITHGSSPRTNAGQRRVMIYRYSPSSIMPRFNYPPSRKLLERLTPQRRALIEGKPMRLAPGRTLI
jgi:ectoine hydroxylase-related dioxygenase (phytanoyl-CoA dioxygenase family)